MSFYWIIANDGTAACHEADTISDAQQAAAAALRKIAIVSVKRLPEAANPALPGHSLSGLPFCHTPNRCAGQPRCQNNPVCND